MPDDPTQNLARVAEKISMAAQKYDRKPADVSLVAVSKTHDAARIRPFLDLGHRCFGENRVQEAMGKWPELRQEFGDIELHLIGPLQTNKVREAVANFDVIETVDRPKLAGKLAEEMSAQARRLPIYVQVNTGLETQKGGVAPAEADEFIEACRSEYGLSVVGLMCIPPQSEEPSLHYMLLAQIAERNGLAGLSMGMSGDYETAIQFGATSVRVGTVLFGARQIKD
jgi:pyridoxal phosphate enzyme (YggS family)